MKQDFTIWRNQILQNPRDISPLKFGISQDEVIEIFGNPDAVSTMRSDGKPLILKYHDIELHFDGKAHHGLHLIYSDDEIELSITAEHEETLQPITNTEPVDNEFFLRDGAVYFSGLYENGLLKGVAPKDFCCWRYWGKSSTACFLGGIRLRGADPASFRVLNYAYAMDKTAVYTTSGRIPDVELAAFQVLDNGQNDSGAPQGYAKDSRQVYFHNGDGRVKIIKGAEVSSFRSLGDTYFARDEKRIYAYGKQLPKADLPSWELLSHWYSRDARRVYYLNREIKGADRDSFVVCTPLDAAPLADHLLIFCGNRYRERLAALVCKVYLLADFQVLRTREICDLKCENRVRIRHSVSFLRHQVDLLDLTDFHIRNCRVKSLDHLSSATYKL